jgi:hypothetical protein
MSATKRDRPRYGLDKRAGETLAAMSYNTDLPTLDVLPGAGPLDDEGPRGEEACQRGA